MAIVKILPAGLEIEVEPGTTMLKAAVQNELCWPHTCGGNAQCTTCAYLVIKGAENLSPASRLEQHQLVARKGRAGYNPRMRLACQTVINGDVTVQKHLMVI